MDKAIKKSFQIIFKNSAVMQPLIMFILFILIFNTFMGMSVLTNPVAALIFMVLSILLFSAFLSGWLYTIKYAVDTYQEFDKNDEDYALKVGIYNVETLKKFFSGVGEYFMPILLVVVLGVIFVNLMSYCGQKLLNVTDLQFLTQEVNNNIQSVSGLPKINLNQILFAFYMLGMAFIFRFLTLFWLPAVYYQSKNPFVSLFESLKFLFRNFLVSVGLYFLLFSIYSIFFVLAGFSTLVPILPLIFFIILLYLITFSVVFIFSIYRQILVKEEVEKVNAKDVFTKSSEIFEVENKEDEQK